MKRKEQEEDEMNYEEWKISVPGEIQADSVWKMKAYRLALFVGELGWHDTSRLIKNQQTRSLSNQLYRALGSISANLAEGYSRGSNKKRAHFYEYSLGSARESRDWYYKARHILGEEVLKHRLGLLTEIIRLLLTMIPQQRGKSLHESKSEYHLNDLDSLLENIPM